MTDQRVHEIDGLRALAMLLVTAQHCGLAPIGWTGVWLFFVVSGFVIARNFEHGAYQGDTRRARWLDFMRRRFWRIVPVYVLYVAFVLALLWSLGRTRDLHMAAGLLTFTYNWQTIFAAPQSYDAVRLLSYLWTISVEEQFYLAFPLLALLLGRRSYLVAIVVIVVASPVLRLAWSAYAAGWTTSDGARSYAVYAASFVHFDAFLIGALIARFEAAVRRNERIVGWSVALALGALACHISVFVAVNWSSGAVGVAVFRNVLSGQLVGHGREATVYTAVALVAAAAVIGAIRGRPSWLARPWLVAAGRVSYGAYIVHGFVIWLALEALGPLATLTVPHRIALFALSATASFALAALSWRWFEEPIRRWGTCEAQRKDSGLRV